MKNILKIFAALAAASCLFSCHKEFIIPDPGFDMSESIQDTVRRDTSAVYHIAFNIKAPNGVRFIQLVNGRNYEVIKEFDEYTNKTNFEFSYDFDLSEADADMDSLFVYNIKIRTNDNRGYNKSIRIQQLKLSHPEIIGPSSTMNIFGRAFVYDGSIDTGYYSVEEIKTSLNGKECMHLTSNDLNGVTKYRLYEKITQDFVVGQKYTYEVFVKSSSGETKTFTYNLVCAALKKPVAIKYTNGTSQKAAKLYYNDKGQVECYYDPYEGDPIIMQYDENGRLTHQFRTSSGYIGNLDYQYGPYGYSTAVWYNYNEDGSFRRFCDFGYSTLVGDTLHKLLDPWWQMNELVPESCLPSDIPEGDPRKGFVRSCTGYNDYTMNKYITSSSGKRYISEMHGANSTVLPVGYLEDFEEGKLLSTRIVATSMVGVHGFYGYAEEKWAEIKSFVPVLNPLYIEDFPTFGHLRYAGYINVQMFGFKYVASSVTRPQNGDSYTGIYNIPYEVREDGLLRSFGAINYELSSNKPTITYYYDDDDPSLWEPYLVDIEKYIPWFKP